MRQRGFERGRSGKCFVRYLDNFPSVLRLLERFGDNEGNPVANVADLSGC
jgi:hypothetical protein